MQITREFSRHQVIPVVFAQTDVVADQTNVQLKNAGGQVDGVTMPFAGVIVALALDLSAAASAGSLTVGVTINGTEVASTTQTVTTGTAARAVFDRDAIPFAAGDKLGVEITTNSAWNGVTADLAAIVYAALAVQGI